MKESQDDYINSIYSLSGGKEKNGVDFNEFKKNIISDKNWQDVVFQEIQDKADITFDEFVEPLKKKELTVQGYGSGSNPSQPNTKVTIDELLAMPESSTTEDPKKQKSLFEPVTQQADVLQTQQPKPQEISKKFQDLEKQGFVSESGNISGAGRLAEQEPKLQKESRRLLRQDAENIFLTEEQKQDASLYRSMIKSGVDPMNPDQRFQDILNERNANIDEQILKLEQQKTDSNFGQSQRNIEQIDNEIKKLQKRKEFFFNTPDENITKAIESMGFIPTKGDKYAQITKIVEDKMADLKELQGSLQTDYKESPFSEALFGGLHGMGVVKDEKRDQINKLKNELKAIVPVILTNRDPELEEDDFFSTLSQAIRPEVLKGLTEQQRGQAISNAINQSGLKLDPKDAEKIKKVSNEYKFGGAVMGEMVGSSLKMGAEVAVGAMTGSAIASGINKVIPIANALSKIESGRKAIDLYNKSSVARDVIKSAGTYQLAGTIFNEEDELNAISGAFGAFGGQFIGSKIAPLLGKIPDKIKNEFLSKLGVGIANVVGAGTGELIQESAEQLGGYINQAIKDGSLDKIGEYFYRDFKNLDDVAKFAFGSIVVGGVARLGMGNLDVKELTSEQKSQINEMMKAVSETYDEIAFTSINSEDLENINTGYNDLVDNGIITEEEKNKNIAAIKEIVIANEKISESLLPFNKLKAQALILEKQDLEKQIEGKDPALIEDEKQKIDDINEELKSIKQSETQTQNEKETIQKEGLQEINPQEQIQESLNQEQNAIQEQATDEGVLRQERPEMGLQEMEQGNKSPIEQEKVSQEKIAPDEIAFTDNIAENLKQLSNQDLSNKDQSFFDKIDEMIDKGIENIDKFQKEGKAFSQILPVSPILAPAAKLFLKTLKETLKITKNFTEAIKMAYDKAYGAKDSPLQKLNEEQRTEFNNWTNTLTEKRRVSFIDKIEVSDENISNFILGAKAFAGNQQAINKYIKDHIAGKGLKITPKEFEDITKMSSKFAEMDMNSEKFYEEMKSFVNSIEFRAERSMASSYFIKKRQKLRSQSKKANIVDNLDSKNKSILKSMGGLSTTGQSIDFIKKYNEIATDLIGSKKLDVRDLESRYNSMMEMYNTNPGERFIKFSSKKDIDSYLNVIQSGINELKDRKLETLSDLKEYISVFGEPTPYSLLNRLEKINLSVQNLLDQNKITGKEADDIIAFTESIKSQIKEKASTIKNKEEDFSNKRFIQAKANILSALNTNETLFTKEERDSIKPLASITKETAKLLDPLEIEDLYLASDLLSQGMINKHIYDVIANIESKVIKDKALKMIGKVDDKFFNDDNIKKVDNNLKLSAVQDMDAQLNISKELDKPIVDIISEVRKGSTKVEAERNQLLKKFYDSYNKISPSNKVVQKLTSGLNKGINPLARNKKAMELFRHQVGLILTQKRYEQQPVLFNGEMINFDELPVEMRDKFKFLMDTDALKESDAKASVGVDTFNIMKEAHSGLIKDENGNIDTKANLDLLYSDPKTKAFLESIRETLKSMTNKTRVAAHKKGIAFNEEDEWYFPAQAIENVQKATKEKAIDSNVFQALNAGFASMASTPGAAHQISRGLFFTETDVLSVVTDHVSETLMAYHLQNPLKALLNGFELARKEAKANAGIVSKEEKQKLTAKLDLLSKIKDNLEKKAQMTFAELRREGTPIIDFVARIVRRMSLGTFRRFPSDFSANMIKILINQETIDSKFKDYNHKAWSDLMEDTGSPLILKYNKYQDQVDPVNKSLLAEAVDKIQSFADVPASRIYYKNAFTSNFKKITGEEFDIKKYSSDPFYKAQNMDAIEKASLYATNAVDEVMNSQDSFGQAVYTKIIPFINAEWNYVEKDKSIAKLLNFMLSYGINDTAQLLSKGKDLINGTNEGRKVAAARITGILISNVWYGLTMQYMTELIKALAQEDLPDEDKDLLRALKEVKDKSLESSASSLLSLLVGRYSAIPRSIMPIILSYYESSYNRSKDELDVMLKNGDIDSDEYSDKLKAQTELFGKVKDVSFDMFGATSAYNYTEKSVDISKFIVKVMPIFNRLTSELERTGGSIEDILDYKKDLKLGEKEGTLTEEARLKEDIFNILLLINTASIAILPTPLQPEVSKAISSFKSAIPLKRVEMEKMQNKFKKMSKEDIEKFIDMVDNFVEVGEIDEDYGNKQINFLLDAQKVFYGEDIVYEYGR